MASHKQVEKKKLAYNTSEIKNNHGNKVNELCPYLLWVFFWKLSHFEKLHIKYIYIYIYLFIYLFIFKCIFKKCTFKMGY